MNFKATPITLRQAQEFIGKHHRHSDKPWGCRFAIGCSQNGVLVGVATAGRPVCCNYPHYTTLEVTRVATDGTVNACSFLYSRCIKIAELFGYDLVITYTLESETGASLLASRRSKEPATKVRGKQFSHPSRPRKIRKETPSRFLWILWRKKKWENE